jgi:ParB family chromosome partitioning protein
MAKRKRLEVPAEPFSGELETKSAFSSKARMPIAEVAGDTAGRAALEEVAAEMTAAEDEGRVIKKLPLDKIDIHHLNRDRLVIDEEEMEVLKTSLAERGQQSPIEVLSTGGRYGLISGLRRVLALKALEQGEVLALVRRPESAEAAYVAMVEENEIRADLSFYERANLVVTAAGSGVYPDPKAAVAGLFAHVPAPKRSKILKFVTLRERIGRVLKFPAAIPEKLGLALVAAIETDVQVATRVVDALRKTPAEDAAAERRVLERALSEAGRKKRTGAAARGEDLGRGVRLELKKGRVILSGDSVDEAFVEALKAWVASH